MSSWQHLLVEDVDPITRITLNRPDRRNALSLDLMRELQQALEQAAGGWWSSPAPARPSPPATTSRS